MWSSLKWATMHHTKQKTLTNQSKDLNIFFWNFPVIYLINGGKFYSETYLVKYISKSKAKATFYEKIWQDQDLNQGPLDPYSTPYQLSYQCLTEWAALFIIKILSRKKFFGKNCFGSIGIQTQDPCFHSLVLYHWAISAGQDGCHFYLFSLLCLGPSKY